MSDEQIIGCTADELYSTCVKCRFITGSLGCVAYRRTYDAVVKMEDGK